MATSNPLQILVITSRPLVTQGGHSIALLDVAEERQRIRDGLEQAGVAVRVCFLPEATTGEVKTALRDQWDIVHFTGHGTDDGLLVLEDGFGVAHQLSRQEMSQLFTEQHPPLVVLSACYSETVGRALHGAGISDVIAIDARTPISDQAAIIFAGHFYAALAKGWNIRKAFEDARDAVALDPEVGDNSPPRNKKGELAEPWSQRFKLIGEAQRTIAVSTGVYQETNDLHTAASNLRVRNTNFVGRAKEIVEVVEAFDKGKASRVAVYGSGGMGKTELSKATAWWYIERERVDVILWASASNAESDYRLLDLASLLTIAAKTFGLPFTEQTRFDEQKNIAREFLSAHRSLLLLDNWETIEARARRELWDFVLSLPQTTRVLITSRDFLPPKDARNLELDTLAPDDAVNLFVKVASNAGYFDRNSLLEEEQLTTLDLICERLSGYPLALEVVAGQTVSRTLDEIWRDLQNVPKNVLEGTDELTNESRGIWTSLDLSYNVLPAPEKTMFRQMSIFLVPVSAEDIAAITEIKNSRHVLDTLVRRSLVRMRQGSYALLPVVRDYAEGKFSDAGEDAVQLHRRAAAYYRQKATIEEALTASEHLFQLATRFNLQDAAEEFAAFIREFYSDLVVRGYWSEARRKDEQLIVVSRALGNKKSEADALGDLASRYHQIGEYQLSLEYSQKAQEIFNEIKDQRGVTNAMHMQGILAQQQGDYEQAKQMYQESLRIKEEIADRRGHVRVLAQLGNLQLELGSYDEAKQSFQRCLKDAEELKADEVISAVLHQLGILAFEQGEHDEARQLCQKSLTIKERLGHKEGIALTLGQLGQISFNQGELKEALDYLLQALQIFETLDSPYLHIVVKDIALVRNVVGDAQFATWLSELAVEAGQVLELLEQNDAGEAEQDQ